MPYRYLTPEEEYWSLNSDLWDLRTSLGHIDVKGAFPFKVVVVVEKVPKIPPQHQYLLEGIREDDMMPSI